MITKPTVLILGAGASIPYGYPSGARLLQDICDNLGSSHLRSLLLQCAETPEQITIFRKELSLSQQPSVDAFLEHRTEFEKIGKLSIAHALLIHENEEMLTNFEIRNQGWYHFLFNQLNAGWGDFGKNTLSIITFNYDRSLEHFLFSALSHTHGKSDKETADEVSRIPIIHVHGWLGPLPWQEATGTPYDISKIRELPTDLYASLIQRASEKILVLSEGHQATTEFQRAFDYLSSAERIYFLGFGYHPQNMERLRLHELSCLDVDLPVKFALTSMHMRLLFYRGSAFGLGKAQSEAIQKEWHIGLPDNSSDCIIFLKEYAILD